MTRRAAQFRADVARAEKAGEDSTALRQEEAVARILEHARRISEKAPPLTAEQRDRLALLLRVDTADLDKLERRIPTAGDA